MTYSKRLGLLLALPALAAIPASARAGDYGPTSRGTLSISVTIPPRVLVAAPPAGATDSLCLASSGLGTFHVAIVPSRNEAADARRERILLTPEAAPQACAGLGSSLPAGRIEALAAAGAGGDARDGATLLIVPD